MGVIVVELRLSSKIFINDYLTLTQTIKNVYPTNQLFKEEFVLSNNLTEAADIKCKELKIKKKAYQYKDELDKLKLKYETLEKLNINYKKNFSKFTPIVKCENLIGYNYVTVNNTI